MAASWAWRKGKASRLPAVALAPGKSGTLITALGLFNPRTDGMHGWKEVSEPNIPLLRAYGEGDAAKFAAIAMALAGKLSKADGAAMVEVGRFLGAGEGER